MQDLSKALQFILSLTKAQSVIARRLDGGLNGISFSEFMILRQLSLAPEEKMRRIDLAEKIGLTASGVTRLLVPMEKIGLVKREMNERDARVRYVALAPGGKTKYQEAIERAEYIAGEFIPASKLKNLDLALSLISEI